MSVPHGRETEIKLRATDAEQARRRLERAGFRVVEPRVLESNAVYDNAEQRLRKSGTLLRLRTAGGRALLTFKGPSEGGRHKTRQEIEAEVGDADALAQILERLGFKVAFRYEKYRTEFEQDGGEGRAMLDETPAGVFIELEGPGEWIDRTAHALGYAESDYLTASYAQLHASSEAGRAGQRDMVFSGEPRPLRDRQSG
jgi:adenylate cyclase class 2